MKKFLVFAITAVMVLILPVTAFAAMLENNPASAIVAEVASEDLMDINEGTVTTNSGEINHNYGTITGNNGTISYNYGTIDSNDGALLNNTAGAVVTTNNGEVSTNAETGLIIDNSGDVYINEGTVENNSGTVSDNFGTVTNNTGTVVNNFCGTVTGGTVTNDYAYMIDFPEDDRIYFVSGTEDGDDVSNSVGTAYIKDGASVIACAIAGYKFAGAPVASGGIVTDNEDGTYTLSGITGDITLTASVEFVPVTEIVGVPDTVPAGEVVTLGEVAMTKPSAAFQEIEWEIVDAGDTGAVIDDPYSGTFTPTAEGTLVVRATVLNGEAVGTPYTQEFTITVTKGNCSIVFMNGEEEFTSTSCPHGDTLGIAGMPTPSKEGYKFVGWYTEDGIWVVHGMTVTEDLIAYATWEEAKPDPEPEPKPEPELDPEPKPDPESEPKPEKAPPTGDRMNIVLWFGLLLVSGSAVLGAVFTGVKRKR